MTKEVLKVGQVILTRSSQVWLDEYGRVQNNLDHTGDGLLRRFVYDLEIVSSLSRYSFGGGYLRDWPGSEARVEFLSAGTRSFSDVVAILGQLSLNEFIYALRAWESCSTPEQMATLFRLPPRRVELANFDTGISMNNYGGYLRAG